MDEKIKQLFTLLPKMDEKTVDFERIKETILSPFYHGLISTMQNPLYHAEGNVYTHTEMVTQALVETDQFGKEEKSVRLCLFLAALFHDVGKIKTTRLENGAWTSPHHAEAGERAVRAYLWNELGLSGTKERVLLREAVCSYIRYHMKPSYLPEYTNARRTALRYASEGELLPLFSLFRLCLLAEADARGRISDDLASSLEKIAFTRELIREYACENGAYPFPTRHTKFSYLSGKNISPELAFYDDTKFEVVMLSGLPGVGKDTYISDRLHGMREISLDKIRTQMKISPSEPQGAVIAHAREQARELLRKQIPFVWNATNLTDEVRQNQVELFSKYGARTKIIYLECDYGENLLRNRNREAYVPEQVIERLVSKTRPPRPYEAHSVEWEFV